MLLRPDAHVLLSEGLSMRGNVMTLLSLISDIFGENWAY